MKFIEEDTYVCSSCGCMFAREELGENAPALNHAIDQRDDINCISCGKLGMNYMSKGLGIMFKTTR